MNLKNLEKQQDTILISFLSHAVSVGWTRRAFEATATDLGIDQSILETCFPNGLQDLAIFFNEKLDKLMLAQLEKTQFSTLPVRERIFLAVKSRLIQSREHIEVIKKLIVFLSLPTNFLLGTKLAYRTINTIWYAAGDTSTDLNFYSKRGLLIAIYTATTLYWLKDTSADSSDTWDFLDRRISEVMKIPLAKLAVQRPVKILERSFSFFMSRLKV